MVAEHIDLSDGRIPRALAELKSLILAQFPTATFDVGEGDDPCGMYMEATLDVDNTDDAAGVVLERLQRAQVDEGLPVYVFFARTPERIEAALRRERRAGDVV
ncbi:MAG: hypothetical protein ACYDCQ_19310 [Dehalococcoidia bacterium]